MMELPHDLLQGWDIVVIDDEDDSLLVADIILNEYGANIHTATDGEEGFKIIDKVRPRFVISDLSMPVMDGWGMLQALKQNEELRSIPVIALTAHAMRGDAERALKAGFHNYLTKPLTVDTFIQDLVNLLNDIPELAEELNI
jgi:CheY-like chemotaxis protein